MIKDSEEVDRFFDILCLNNPGPENLTPEEKTAVCGVKLHMQGEFTRSDEIFRLLSEQTEKDFLYTLSLIGRCFSALAVGNKRRWLSVVNRLKKDNRCCFENNRINEMIEFSILGNLPGNGSPLWLKNGDFYGLPETSIPFVSIIYLCFRALRSKTGLKSGCLPLLSWIIMGRSDILKIYAGLLAADIFEDEALIKDYRDKAFSIMEDRQYYVPAASYYEAFGDKLKSQLEKYNRELYTRVVHNQQALIEGWYKIYCLNSENCDGCDNLTIKEMWLVQLISEGNSNRDISERMGYSEGTVRNYISDLYIKLGIDNRQKLMHIRDIILPGL